MMHLPRCILILLAGKKYVLLFVDFPALFSSLGYTSTYTRRRFSAECCVQLVEFLNFCPILIVISANFIFNKALTTAINVSFFNPSLQIVRVDTSFLAYILIDFVMNIFFSFSGENLVFQGSSSQLRQFKLSTNSRGLSCRNFRLEGNNDERGYFTSSSIAFSNLYTAGRFIINKIKYIFR